ncbi:hypothetical protein [Catellatospora sichuanensis]|uniref:hypothetical protein n=1 Tax=Catellatospora sichuanensis TaxID=1969805 RepID=UPI001181CA9E|nr:hypothetical protein [Catellatospora sichuanensis]
MTAVVLALAAALATGGCGTEGSLAPWRLAGTPPAPSATSVDILVTEMACNGGRSADGRIADPEISYEDDRIVVTMRTVPRGGANTCQENPETPYRLELDEPLGDRVLMDGTLDPPAAPGPNRPTHVPGR